MDDSQKARLARNEDLFRDLNEQVRDSAEAHGADAHVYEFFCECSDPSCMERVGLTLAEYEHIRSEPRRFVVRKDHVVREIEHVVEEVSDHMVVEKHGHAGHVAVQLEGETAGDD